jgi:hypothetical protein
VSSDRGVVYRATVIDPAGGPVVAPAAGTPVLHGIDGYTIPTPLVTRAVVPYGVRLRVMLDTTPHGPAWSILEGPHRGAHVPHHHPSWSVNPVGPPVPVTW